MQKSGIASLGPISDAIAALGEKRRREGHGKTRIWIVMLERPAIHIFPSSEMAIASIEASGATFEWDNDDRLGGEIIGDEPGRLDVGFIENETIKF